MIDVWLLFVAFIPFAEVILHTRITMIRQKLKKADEMINNVWGVNAGEGNGLKARGIDALKKKDTKALKYSIHNNRILLFLI